MHRTHLSVAFVLFLYSTILYSTIGGMSIIVVPVVGIGTVPARLGKGQGANEIGHNLAREQPKFGHNLVRERHIIGHSLERE